jgi:hypothetical protein
LFSESDLAITNQKRFLATLFKPIAKTELLKSEFRTFEIFFNKINGNPSSPQPLTNLTCNIAPCKRIEHQILGVGKKLNKKFWKRRWKARRVRVDSGLSACPKVPAVAFGIGKFQKIGWDRAVAALCLFVAPTPPEVG